MNEQYHTYILASKPRGALYVGMSDDLEHSVHAHKTHRIDGLTSLYSINQLVYFEVFEQQGSALLREQDLKRLHRCLKIRLIERCNPDWRDLFADFVGD